jgi:hypothetical protein
MKRSKLLHKNFSTIKSYDIMEQEDYCVSMATLNSVFDYYDNDLEKQIARRARLEVLYLIFRTIFQKIGYVVFFAK